MERLKKTITKRNIFSAAALLFSIAILWIFKDNIAANLFGAKSFAKLALPQQSILAVAFILLGSVIVYNLIEYLFPDNLFRWAISTFLNRKNTLGEATSQQKSDSPVITFAEFWFTCCVVFVSAFILVLSEWLFWITKESFMDTLSAFEKGSILIQSNWIVSIGIIMILFILWIIAVLIRVRSLTLLVRWIFRLTPALILAVTAVLVFDNFTYIILGAGIVDSYSVFRASYGLAFLLFVNKTFIKLHPPASQKTISAGWKVVVPLAIMLMSLGTVSTALGISSSRLGTNGSLDQTPERTPNIILIGSDGVPADNLSIYGYKRETTPFMNSIRDQALIANSNYAQTGSSWGSLISIFTSKLPTQTRVVNLPDALVGNDSYEHLPGLLRQYGYTNIDITYERYANASLANVRNGFDRINGVDIKSNMLIARLARILPVNSQYNLDLMIERITDRLEHIFFIKIMDNPYRNVLTLTGRKDATSRIPELMELVENGKQPFFIHVHLLGTHGPTYKTVSTQFSQGQKQVKAFDENFFDDAVVDFDSYIANLFANLKANGKLDHTLVIIYSDHPRKRSAYQRTPLIFWFPKAEYTGTILENTENMDIAPTILNYLGVDVPAWMDGKSLISGSLAADRPIFSVLWKDRKKNLGMDPAFRQFGFFRVVVCNRYVQFSSTKLIWESGDVVDRSDVCRPDQVLSDRQMIDLLLKRLQQDGFDTTLMQQASSEFLSSQ